MKNQPEIKTADKLLNAAEKLFSENSYNEVSIRDITSFAGVKLALVHYHFGSKEELYRTIIRRRIGKLSRDRLSLLKHFHKKSNDAPISLESIVEAFLAPYLFNTLYGGAGWREYAIIVARLLSSGSELSLSILQEEFDPSASYFLDAMRKSKPEASEQQIQWGFDFLVGSMCNIFAEVDRIQSLSENLCTIHTPEISCQYLFNYISAGLNGVLSTSPHDFSSSFKFLKKQK